MPPGVTESYEALKNKYFWPNMKDDVTEFINSCETCRKAKYDRHPPRIKYNLTLTPNKPFLQTPQNYSTLHNSHFNRPFKRFHLNLLENIRIIILQNVNILIKQIVQLAMLG